MTGVRQRGEKEREDWGGRETMAVEGENGMGHLRRWR